MGSAGERAAVERTRWAAHEKQTPEPMPLTTGTRLGPYEVVAAIGAGGMGACGRGERATRVEPQRAGVGPRAHSEK